jgi:hypothetical protein
MMKNVMKKEELRALVETLGRKYSEILEIRLSLGTDEELFKWFLASMLFGAPISEAAVLKTHKCFQNYKILTPKRILQTGWDRLVKVLDEGSYTRYDFKTADKLLLVSRSLLDRYGGSMNRIHSQASDARDLERRLKDLGKGIGDITVSIFLRELRDVWKKADPYPTPLVARAAEQLEIVKTNAPPQEVLERLKDFWRRNAITGQSFVNFETALLRLEKDYLRKGRSFRSLVSTVSFDRRAV